MKETLTSLIEQIIDPDLGKTLGELGAIHDVNIEGPKVTIKLKLYPPLHRIAEALNTACKRAVHEQMPGALVEVLVHEILPAYSPTRILPNVKHFIAVSSGKGGVGKSTVTANLAVALAETGASVGLLDADIHGPSAPIMFGLEGKELLAEKREDGKIIGFPHEQYGVKVCSIGFIMAREQAAIMRGPMQAGYLNTLLDQMDWGNLDYLLFDLPPGTGDIHLTLTQRVPLTGAVVVTTPQEVALADARRGISMFRRVNVPILGVIENMSFYALPDGTREYVFGKDGGKNIAQELESDFLGEIPLHKSIREGGDNGKPAILEEDSPAADAFREVADMVIRNVRKRAYELAQSNFVQISL